jgi:DNA-binding protein Fis
MLLLMLEQLRGFEVEMRTKVLPLAEAERIYVLRVLKLCGNNRTHTARLLGISIRGLRMKLRKYKDEGISVPGVRSHDSPAA